LDRLSVEFREVLVLRELEDFSYKEIAAIADIPMRTVMSRLARARKRWGAPPVKANSSRALPSTSD
jgi:RNA polymerase sigma-70 factor (ECF subfamily)